MRRPRGRERRSPQSAGGAAGLAYLGEIRRRLVARRLEQQIAEGRPSLDRGAVKATMLGEEFADFFRSHRLAEDEALRLGAAFGANVLELIRGFDAFRRRHHPE